MQGDLFGAAVSDADRVPGNSSPVALPAAPAAAPPVRMRPYQTMALDRIAAATSPRVLKVPRRVDIVRREFDDYLAGPHGSCRPLKSSRGRDVDGQKAEPGPNFGAWWVDEVTPTTTARRGGRPCPIRRAGSWIRRSRRRGIDWSRPEHLNRTCPACAASQVGTTAELVENHSRSLRKQTRDAERGLPRTRTFAIRSYVTFRDEPERIDVWDVTAPNVETALRLEHRRLRRAFPLAKSWEVQWESPAGHSWTHHAEVRR